MQKGNEMNEYIIKFDGGENEYLSNFYLIDVEFEGLIYPSTEHSFQAAKTLSTDERKFIKNTATPGAAKRMGRKANLRVDWEEVKEDVMLECLRQKFKNEELRKKLLQTGERILVEGNRWHDCYWGVCWCDKCNGVGKNRLGTLLMKVRGELEQYKKHLIAIDKLTTKK